MTETVAEHRHVHRPLHLQTPPLKGQDVRALQEDAGAVLDHYGFPWRAPNVDGQLGPQTLHAAAFEGFLIGLSPQAIATIKHGRPLGHGRHTLPLLTEHVQRVLRNPEDRSRADRLRAKRRHDQIVRLRRAHDVGPRVAVEWAMRQVGTHEQPPGSNLGPGITEWERNTGYDVPPGVYWCGCFVHQAVVVIGGAVVPNDHVFGYGPSIIACAQSATNGLHAVPYSQARMGDVAVLWGGEHVVLVRGLSSGGLLTVEGNTSASDGSQSNGGEVALKERGIGDVSVIARVDHWSH